MKVVLIVDERRGFAWQDEVAHRLAAAGHAVTWRPVAGAPPWPRLVDLVVEVERLSRRYRGPGLFGAATRSRDAGSDRADVPSVLVDLTGRDEPDPPDPHRSQSVLRPLYDGSPDPAAIVAALLETRMPRLAVAQGDRIVAAGLPANERPDVLAAGLDFAFARVVDLVVQAIVAPHARPAADTPDRTASPAPRTGLGPARFAAAGLAAKLANRLTRRLVAPEIWRVGWRRLDGPSIRETGIVAAEGWTWLPDDGRRYFADPFLLPHGGRLWAFVEEYVYATAKAVISAFEIGPDGRAGEPRVVLETPGHLSYPFVFEDGGEIWMIPESQAAGEIALYRALDFPWRWTRERRLVAGLASDATPVRAGGRVWLFASTQERSAAGEALGSSWDTLKLFSAPDFGGEFVPHPAGSLLVDAASARPAGPMWRQGGHLMRAAQDCRAGYGAGLALCRVDRLDDEGYGQTIERMVTAPAAWGATGLHTLGLAGGYEVVDCFGPAVGSAQGRHTG